MNDFDEMEEPVPCSGCDDWVELQSTRECWVCEKLFGRCCMAGRVCKECRKRVDNEE
jgi:hypothetical protein